MQSDPQVAKRHGWLGTEKVSTRFGEFEFKGGYPTSDTARRLSEQLFFNRAVEAYLEQMPAVSWYNVWKGVATAGPAAANQLVIWEHLMNADTLLLTGNTETVYGLASLELRRDGPVVIEAPAGLLGGISDMWQNELAGIGPIGLDKGQGGRFLLLAPDHTGPVPGGYLVVRCSNFRVSFAVRGFLVDGKPDPAVARLKTIRIYPLVDAEKPPAMTFVDDAGKRIDTIFSDNYAFFDDLVRLVHDEPSEVLSSHERFQLAAIGIEKGKAWEPDAAQKKLLGEAASFGSALARANSFASDDPARVVYPDRKWEWAFIGGSASWDAQGYVNSDRRAAFAYIAIGMSPAMVKKVVGQGSQYLWTHSDAAGAYLDGGKSYRLRLPANIPVKNFWSVVVYDAQSRSLLKNDQDFPSVSQFTGPEINPDGSVDVYFGPKAPPGKDRNFIQTVPGKGWFPLLRFYGPLEAFFDKSWKPDDIVLAK